MAPEMDPMLWRRQSLEMHLRAARMQEVPDGAGAAAALVLATQEFVANGRGRPSDRRRRSAAWPGRTGSRGRVGRRGCWRSKRAVIVGAVLAAAFVDRLSGSLARTQQ